MDTKPCPFCGEPILVVAIKCKHCGEFLSGKTHKKAKAEEALGVVHAVLVLGAAAAFLWWFMKPCSGDERAQTQPVEKTTAHTSIASTPAPEAPPDLTALASLAGKKQADAEALVGVLAIDQRMGACRVTCPDDTYFRCNAAALRGGRFGAFEVRFVLRDGLINEIEIAGRGSWASMAGSVKAALGAKTLPVSCKTGAGACWWWRPCTREPLVVVDGKPFDATAIMADDGGLNITIKDWTTRPSNARYLSFDEAMNINERLR